jgi:glucan endo-1,3-alpha-glucosidase
VLVVPGFYQATPSTTFFSNRGSLDGVFNWNSWPSTSAGKVTVSSVDDKTFQTAAQSASKLFMMGISPIQFKHLSTDQNWYRRGEDNLEYRFGQALELQPDMLQLQTWNDAGESHYMGNLWPEPMSTNAQIQKLVDGYDHKGYWQILQAFIQAWKRGDTTTKNMVPTNGKNVQGVFWHHTLTVGATCTGDSVPKPDDIAKAAEDAVSGIILVAKGKTGLVAVANVGTKELGKLTLVEGYNKFKFPGVTPGKVQVEIWDGSTMIGGGYGSIEVKSSASLCNYNFQVVGFPG